MIEPIGLVFHLEPLDTEVSVEFGVPNPLYRILDTNDASYGGINLIPPIYEHISNPTWVSIVDLFKGLHFYADHSVISRERLAPNLGDSSDREFLLGRESFSVGSFFKSYCHFINYRKVSDESLYLENPKKLRSKPQDRSASLR